MADSYVYNATAPDGSGATYSGPVSGLPEGYQMPGTPPASSMPADALGKNPTTYSSYFPPATASGGLAESAMASKDSYLAGLAKEADAAKATEADQSGQIKSIFDRLGLSSTSKVNAESAAGLPEQQQELNDLTANMDQVSRSFDKQIEDVQTNNPSGELASGVSNDVNRLQRQKASTLADLAIVLNAKTNNFNTAKQIVDAKADAETEDLKTQLQGLQFFYNENKDTLSKDQQTLLQDKIDAADKEYQDARQTRSDVGNVQFEAAKNGAPVPVVQAIGKAQSMEDAITAAGTYLQSGTGANIFSQSQKNNGAANAGLSISDFANLTPDDQNYFINGYSNFSAAMKAVQNGTATQEALKTAIDEAPLSESAKNILYQKAGIDPSAPAKTGGFFSSAAKFVENLFSS